MFNADRFNFRARLGTRFLYIDTIKKLAPAVNTFVRAWRYNGLNVISFDCEKRRNTNPAVFTFAIFAIPTGHVLLLDLRKLLGEAAVHGAKEMRELLPASLRTIVAKSTIVGSAIDGDLQTDGKALGLNNWKETIDTRRLVARYWRHFDPTMSSWAGSRTNMAVLARLAVGSSHKAKYPTRHHYEARYGLSLTETYWHGETLVATWPPWRTWRMYNWDEGKEYAETEGQYDRFWDTIKKHGWWGQKTELEKDKERAREHWSEAEKFYCVMDGLTPLAAIGLVLTRVVLRDDVPAADIIPLSMRQPISASPTLQPPRLPRGPLQNRMALKRWPLNSRDETTAFYRGGNHGAMKDWLDNVKILVPGYGDPPASHVAEGGLVAVEAVAAEDHEAESELREGSAAVLARGKPVEHGGARPCSPAVPDPGAAALEAGPSPPSPAASPRPPQSPPRAISPAPHPITPPPAARTGPPTASAFERLDPPLRPINSEPPPPLNPRTYNAEEDWDNEEKFVSPLVGANINKAERLAKKPRLAKTDKKFIKNNADIITVSAPAASSSSAPVSSSSLPSRAEVAFVVVEPEQPEARPSPSPPSPPSAAEPAGCAASGTESVPERFEAAADEEGKQQTEKLDFPVYDQAFQEADPKPFLSAPNSHWLQSKTLAEKKAYFATTNCHRALVNVASEGETHADYEEMKRLWRNTKRRAHRRNAKRKREDE